MKYLSRIDKSATRRGEYIGYLNGSLRIRKGGKGWETYAVASAVGEWVCLTAKTLTALNDKFEGRAPKN